MTILLGVALLAVAGEARATTRLLACSGVVHPLTVHWPAAVDERSGCSAGYLSPPSPMRVRARLAPRAGLTAVLEAHVCEQAGSFPSPTCTLITRRTYVDGVRMVSATDVDRVVRVDGSTQARCGYYDYDCYSLVVDAADAGHRRCVGIAACDLVVGGAARAGSGSFKAFLERV